MNAQYQSISQSLVVKPYVSVVSIGLLLLTLISVPVDSFAQAPGVDPLKITKAPAISMTAGAQQQGTGLPERADMPIALKAKIARYTAVAMQNPETLVNSQAIEQQAQSAGFTKSCVQDVGSNVTSVANTASTGAGRYGPRSGDQIVVMRGDLVNICR